MKLYLIAIFNSKKSLNIATSRETYIEKTKMKNGNLETKILIEKRIKPPKIVGSISVKAFILK